MKKVLAAILAVTIAAGSVLVCTAASAKKKMGDVNLDNIVSISDATTIQKHLASYFTLNEVQMKLADVDQNDSVTINDVTTIQRALVGALTLPEATNVPLSNEEVMSTGNETMDDLAVRLLQNSRNLNGGNALVSPLSILNALGMTANGAGSNTLKQMEDAFGMSVSDMNRYCKYYVDNQPDFPSCDEFGQPVKNTFSIANSIWFNKNYDPVTLDPDFVKVANDNYKAGVSTLPFDGNAVNTINDWVNTNTNGMIPQILNNLDSEAIMCLVNALAFECDWAEQYIKTPYYSALSNDSFTNDGGLVTNVTYMKSEEYSYIGDDKTDGMLKAFDDYRYSFAALVPKSGVNLGEYVNSLTGEKLGQILNSRKGKKLEVYLPKYKIEYSEELNDNLKALGMTDAFDPGKADLSKMLTANDLQPYIGQVVHKTAIEVSETGVKAAASTIVEPVPGAAPGEPEKPQVIKFNKPFLYMIIDHTTNTPIFIGTVDYLPNAEAE